MSLRYTFFLPESGQIAADVTEKSEQMRIEKELLKRFLFVPSDQFDIYVSYDSLKLVSVQKIDSTTILKAQEPDAIEPPPID